MLPRLEDLDDSMHERSRDLGREDQKGRLVPSHEARVGRVVAHGTDEYEMSKKEGMWN